MDAGARYTTWTVVDLLAQATALGLSVDELPGQTTISQLERLVQRMRDGKTPVEAN